MFTLSPAVVLEGTRPLLQEVQALCSPVRTVLHVWKRGGWFCCDSLIAARQLPACCVVGRMQMAGPSACVLAHVLSGLQMLPCSPALRSAP